MKLTSHRYGKQIQHSQVDYSRVPHQTFLWGLHFQKCDIWPIHHPVLHSYTLRGIRIDFDSVAQWAQHERTMSPRCFWHCWSKDMLANLVPLAESHASRGFERVTKQRFLRFLAQPSFNNAYYEICVQSGRFIYTTRYSSLVAKTIGSKDQTKLTDFRNLLLNSAQE